MSSETQSLKRLPAENPSPRRPEGAAQSHRSSGGPLWIVIILVVAGLGVWLVARARSRAQQTPMPGAARPGVIEVPVVAGKVGVKDVPIYLDGLGTVQAFNTVTVRARVDGQIQKVAFTEGQDVKTGDLLAQIDPEPFRIAVEQAEAKKAQDDAQLANARVELARDKDLLEKKIVASKDYDDQRALVIQLEASVKADQAAIDNAQVQLKYTQVISPIDGRTGIRLVDQGNLVRATDLSGIVVLTQLHPIAVVFTLPEQTLPQIQEEAAKGELEVLAMDRDNSTVLATGRMAVIDNQIDTTTGTIKLKAIFKNDDLHLWPGQFVNARLHVATRNNSVVVPATVVQRGPDGSFAFVINETNGVSMRPVKVARIQDGVAMIDKGLRPGEDVVIDGQYKLQNGSKVRPNAAPQGGEAAGGDGRSGRRGDSGNPAREGRTDSNSSGR